MGEAGDGLELLDLLKLLQLTPDMIILDISMPNLNGIEAIRQIKMAYPKVKVLILSMHKIKEYVKSALFAGADGYLLKEDADTELFSSIETIQNGGIFISSLLSREVTNDWIKWCSGGEPTSAEEGICDGLCDECFHIETERIKREMAILER